MGKRFTETAKWCDPWYRSLDPIAKHGWNYLCDNCDAAGVINLDKELAKFQIGADVDWDSLIKVSEGRIILLANSKLWVSNFISFQYPNGLSPECKAHAPIYSSIEKNGLKERLSKEYPDSNHTVQEKEKETDTEKEKDSGKGNAKGKPNRKPVEATDVARPPELDTPEVLDAIGRWLKYKIGRGESYKAPDHLALKVAEFARAGPAAFVAAVNSSIGSNYAGLHPAKDHNGQKQSERVGAGQRYRGD